MICYYKMQKMLSVSLSASIFLLNGLPNQKSEIGLQKVLAQTSFEACM